MALVAVISALGAASCGSQASNETEVQITAGVVVASERIFSFNDLTAAGFKSSKTYDVTDLPHAVSAHYGFWGFDPYKREAYEVPLYPGHDEAIRFGQALAVERVGPDAKLTEDTATWKVGVRDARECHGVQGQTQHAASCTEAVYYDYVIVGNMIMLCPGDAIDLARKNCDLLLAQMK